MTAHLGVITFLDTDGRRADVKLMLRQLPLPNVRIAYPPGVMGGLVVGDEVLVIETEGGIMDAVILGWLPSSVDVAAATRPLVLSSDGSVPTTTSAGAPVGHAALGVQRVR